MKMNNKEFDPTKVGRMTFLVNKKQNSMLLASRPGSIQNEDVP
jgi:hypothetical protein